MLDPDKVKEVMNQIPALKDNKRLFLSRTFFVKLTDDQFTTLWYMPGFEIMVNKRTREYIEKRRRGLGLEKTKHVKDETID